MASSERDSLADTEVPRSEVLVREVDGERPMPASSPDVERFEVLGEIGRGGVGSVVAATDRDIGRRVAIKRMLNARLASTAAVTQFVHEVRTVGQLEHPNIVPLHDFGRDSDGNYYFVMKLLEGQTLESIIAQLRRGDADVHRRWTFARRTELFVQILQAMRFAHVRGIVHRDLKPSNVMVGAHGEVHVVDWGLAKRVGDPEAAFGFGREPDTVGSTRVGPLFGTPRYMAPEQTRGEPADLRTDTWQLSLLFYEFLTLDHYLDDLDTLDPVLEGVRNRPIRHARFLSSPHQPPVPGELTWYVMRGLERDPDRRYPDAGAMLAGLERRADGYITVQCHVTAQKWLFNGAIRSLDRWPLWTTVGVVAGLSIVPLSLALAGIGLLIGLLGLLL